MGTELDALLDQLESKNAKERREAVRKLAERKTLSAIPELVVVYQGDRDRRVRKAAGAALKRFRALEAEYGAEQAGKAARATPRRRLVLAGLLLIVSLALNGVVLLTKPARREQAVARAMTATHLANATPTPSPSPTPTPALIIAGVDYRIELGELEKRLAAVNAEDGPLARLGRLWEAQRASDCVVDVSSVPLDYSLPPEAEALDPELALVARRLNRGLVLLRMSIAAYARGCAADDLSRVAEDGRLSLRRAEAAFLDVADLLPAIRQRVIRTLGY